MDILPLSHIGIIFSLIGNPVGLHISSESPKSSFLALTIRFLGFGMPTSGVAQYSPMGMESLTPDRQPKQKAMKTFLSSLALAFVAFSCQMQEDPLVISDDAASGGPNGPVTTAASYSNSYSFSTDGKTLTLTINAADASAKNISHLNFKFNDCDGAALEVSNITSITANGADMMGVIGSVEGKGNDCFGLLADPFIKLDQGFSGFPVVVVINFDTAVKSGNFLLKAGSSNSPTGGGCFGLDNPNYAFSRDCTPPPACYEEDSAWGAGTRYVTRGNWATYTAYQANSSVNIYAGQSKFAGTATMSAVSNGKVTISISLNPGWSLQQVSNPVKIQGYNSAPSGNPSPGRFGSKGSSLTVTVDAASFYGIHLDVRKAVQCN